MSVETVLWFLFWVSITMIDLVLIWGIKIYGVCKKNVMEEFPISLLLLGSVASLFPVANLAVLFSVVLISVISLILKLQAYLDFNDNFNKMVRNLFKIKD